MLGAQLNKPRVTPLGFLFVKLSYIFSTVGNMAPLFPVKAYLFFTKGTTIRYLVKSALFDLILKE
jgi:hypothetical protein